MGRKVVGVVQIAVVAIVGLIVVPTAINVGTGGIAPGWLEPLGDNLWWVVVGSVLLIVVLEAVGRFAVSSREVSRRRPNDPRNYALALEQADQYVRAGQRGSLGERIQLALDEKHAAVRQPAHLET
jgi:hypothetical protein